MLVFEPYTQNVGFTSRLATSLLPNNQIEKIGFLSEELFSTIEQLASSEEQRSKNYIDSGTGIAPEIARLSEATNTEMPVRPPRHTPQGWMPPVERKRFAERERGTPSSRGYDRDWQKLRLVILQRDPLCVFCFAQNKLTETTQVDHIRPITERPDLRLDPSNLRGLCDTCHSQRTAAYKRGDVY